MVNLPVKVFAVAILIALFVGYGHTHSSDIKYPSGRDTIQSYGDGTYQLLHGDTKDGLFDSRYHTAVIDQVSHIEQKDKFVYAIGYITDREAGVKIKVFARIDTEKNQILYCPQTEQFDNLPLFNAYDMMQKQELILLTDYNKFSAEDKEMFQNIQKKQTTK